MNLAENPYAAPQASTSTAGIEWMRTDVQGLSKTALGLSLVYFGIVVLLLCLILSAAAALVPAALIFTMTGVVIAAIMMFVGPLFCLSVPAETNAKGLIMGSVALQLFNLVFAILPMAGIQLPALQVLAQLFGVVSMVLFVLFMRKLSQFIGRDDLSARAKNVLIMAGAVFVLSIVMFAALFTLGPIAGILGFIVAIMGLVMFVMYANLVRALGKALKSN